MKFFGISGRQMSELSALSLMVGILARFGHDFRPGGKCANHGGPAGFLRTIMTHLGARTEVTLCANASRILRSRSGVWLRHFLSL